MDILKRDSAAFLQASTTPPFIEDSLAPSIQTINQPFSLHTAHGMQHLASLLPASRALVSRLLQAIQLGAARLVTPHARCSIARPRFAVEPPTYLAHVIASSHVGTSATSHVTALQLHHPAQPFCSSTYTSARFGYRRSAFSSRNAIHDLRNLLPLELDVSMRVVRPRFRPRGIDARFVAVSQYTVRGFRVANDRDFPAAHVFGLPLVRRAGYEERRTVACTYLLIVSESPIIQRCRFGRVMATGLAHQYRLQCDVKQKGAYR
jgi:hypothetical protein